jgi:imidazolonepropionase-like amidohydrolase
VTGPNAATLSIVGALVMNDAGSFSPRTVVTTADGRFGYRDVATTEVLEASGLWLVPGIYDCHSHITWSEFHEVERATKSEQQRAHDTAAALRLTLNCGVTTLRDAGGADATLQRAVDAGTVPGPRLQISVDMIGADQAGSPDAIAAAVEAALAKGAQWIKLMGTGGTSTSDDAVLRSTLSESEIRTAVEVARAVGARVMIHTWGGDSIDWAIEYGVTSIEHGIYMTQQQVSAAAAAGMTLVPTLTIYRYVRDLAAEGKLGGVAVDRLDAVVAAHERVVAHARDLGLPLCVGSDYGTSEQHGTNLREIGALMRAGLPSSQALLAATINGARLMNDPSGGRIAPHCRADALLLSADPGDPDTFDDPGNVVAVIKDGQVVYRRH